MIEAARKRLPDIAFEVADIRDWRPEEPLDVILANASLQWIPGHETLLPALIARLAPGGALAAQMPDNLDEPSHRLMREIAAEDPGPRSSRTPPKRASSATAPNGISACCAPMRRNVDVWRTTYFHPLAGARAIVEWVKGTGLRPFIDPLEESEREAFLARYEEAIAKAYPAGPDGRCCCRFRGCSSWRRVELNLFAPFLLVIA